MKKTKKVLESCKWTFSKEQYLKPSNINLASFSVAWFIDQKKKNKRVASGFKRSFCKWKTKNSFKYGYSQVCYHVWKMHNLQTAETPKKAKKLLKVKAKPSVDARTLKTFTSPLLQYSDTFLCFTKFCFAQKWNDARLLLINMVYMSCLTSCKTT